MLNFLNRITQSPATAEAAKTDGLAAQAKAKKTSKAGGASDKAKSVQMADQEITYQDLVKESQDKAANLGVSSFKQKTKQKLEKEMRSVAKELMKEETSSKDSVKISAGLVSQKSDEIKKKQEQQKAKVLKETGKQQSAEEILMEDTAQVVQAYSDEAQKLMNAKQKKEKAGVEQKQAKVEGEVEGKTRDLVQKYCGLLAEDIIKSTPQKKEEIRKLKKEFLSKGFSKEKLANVETVLKQGLATELKQKVKDSFLKYALTYTSDKKMNAATNEFLKNYKSLNATMAMVEEMGGDMGKDAKTVLREEAKEVRREVGSLIKEEMEKGLVQKYLQGNPTNEELDVFLKKFADSVAFTGFNFEEFVTKWPSKAQELGLTFFQNPESDTLGLSAGMAGGGQKKDQKKEQENVGEEAETLSLLEDNLRGLLMKKYLNRDLKTRLVVEFKIRTLKNGLKKIGVYKEDLMKRLEEEGKAIAKFKFLKMLAEAFEEKATLVNVKTAAGKLVENKIKTVLRGLKSMGDPMDKLALKSMRNKINRDVFMVVREEFLQVDTQAEANPNRVDLAARRKELLSILERIKEESSIPEDIKPGMFANKGIVDTDKKVNEAA